jgi:hypothetical protein
MAKLYRDPQGGAFGGKLGEVEDIWMGDSFNRGVEMAYCTANASNNTYEKAVNNEVFSNKVDEMRSLIDKLSAEMQTLKQEKKVENQLRTKLKTLQYKREVE